MTTYEIDRAMCGEDFAGDVRRVVELLSEQYPDIEVVAITGSTNGARNSGSAGISDRAFFAAVAQAQADHDKES